MKALDEYFLIVVILQYLCLIWTEKHGSELGLMSPTLQFDLSPSIVLQ